MADDAESGFDSRLTPARPDLAAGYLQGKVKAARFVDGDIREVVDAQAPLRHAPRPDSPLDTEVLKGERVTIYETNEEGWCWGQLATDGYVGWLPANALATPGPDSTHKVIALRTLVFPGPDIKSPPIEVLPFGARLAITRETERFAVTASGGHVPLVHLAPLGHVESDVVAVAEQFLGAPYLWGGKTNLGLDCSGLVQITLAACGIPCLRDSDMQEKTLGVPLDPDIALANIRRGDLVFWKGHVALVRDEMSFIHANAHHMAVAIEPIDAAVKRIATSGRRVTAVKRLESSR